MLISNRKTREEIEVTEQVWQRMKELQKDQLFKVLDKSNVKPAQRMNVPENIVEFQASVPKKIVSTKNKRKH